MLGLLFQPLAGVVMGISKSSKLLAYVNFRRGAA